MHFRERGRYKSFHENLRPCDHAVAFRLFMLSQAIAPDPKPYNGKRAREQLQLHREKLRRRAQRSVPRFRRPIPDPQGSPHDPEVPKSRLHGKIEGGLHQGRAIQRREVRPRHWRWRWDVQARVAQRAVPQFADLQQRRARFTLKSCQNMPEQNPEERFPFASEAYIRCRQTRHLMVSPRGPASSSSDCRPHRIQCPLVSYGN